MNNLSQYIIEKLHINKDTKVDFSADFNDFWFGESDDVNKFPSEFYENRKSIRKENGVQKNKPWYAAYICLRSLGGCAKIEKIRELVWPGKTGQQAELFMGLREYGITESIKSGENRGCQHILDYENWKVPNNWSRNKIF